MARTPIVTRDRVPEPLRAAFDAETASSGGVVATGPGSVMINSPEMRRRAAVKRSNVMPSSTLTCRAEYPSLVPILGGSGGLRPRLIKE